MSRCPSETYEEEELINNPETGEKGFRRICKHCTPDKCPKSKFKLSLIIVMLNVILIFIFLLKLVRFRKSTIRIKR